MKNLRNTVMKAISALRLSGSSSSYEEMIHETSTERLILLERACNGDEELERKDLLIRLSVAMCHCKDRTEMDGLSRALAEFSLPTPD